MLNADALRKGSFRKLQTFLIAVGLVALAPLSLSAGPNATTDGWDQSLIRLAPPSFSAPVDDSAHPTLAIGAAAPNFCLPGIDDKKHCLKEYSKGKLLVVAFTCNHCPTAQLYETRLKQLVADYRNRGVDFVAIEP